MLVSIARLGARARTIFDSDRGWSLAAAFGNRIGGFFTSFVLSRLGGPAVLGAYTAVSNTSSAVVSPLLFAVTNGATIEARRSGSEVSAAALLLAHTLLALLLGAACCVGFLILSSGLGIQSNSTLVTVLALATGLSSVLSQLVAPAMQGVLYGLGEFKRAAIASIVTALVATGLVVPLVNSLGLAGGLLVLATSSVVLPATLLVSGLALSSAGERSRVRHCFRGARSQLARSLPSVGATSVAAGAGWLTSIYLVHRSHGEAGVGVLAIGTQWLTLLVLAVTSWGGVTVRGLAEALETGPAAFRREIRIHVWHNLRITLPGSIALIAAAELIARLYHAGDTEVATVLRINACSALVLAINNVAERALYCSNKQREWLRTSVAGAVVTVALAAWLVPHGVIFVPIASLCGYVVAGASSFYFLHSR